MAKGPESILLPLTYLGPVSYYAYILKASNVTIEVHEHYIKQTYRNRCRIAAANGILDLIIPVVKVNGNHTRVKDIQISNTGKWQLNHWRAIESAYSNSPFFMYYREEIEPIFLAHSRLLMEFNMALLTRLMKLIGFEKEIAFTSSYSGEVGPNILDLRPAFSPKRPDRLTYPEYTQAFGDRWGFQPNLSILDLLFNTGPNAKDYLEALDLG